MGNNLVVKVRYGGWQYRSLAEDKGEFATETIWIPTQAIFANGGHIPHNLSECYPPLKGSLAKAAMAFAPECTTSNSCG
ncbi:MAG: hypothetical protein GX994_00905 [Firmicutes bacterium]|nr:hypothetical protein [Bacillota bacterium]